MKQVRLPLKMLSNLTKISSAKRDVKHQLHLEKMKAQKTISTTKHKELDHLQDKEVTVDNDASNIKN